MAVGDTRCCRKRAAVHIYTVVVELVLGALLFGVRLKEAGILSVILTAVF